MNTDLPSGIVTFLFTDIEESTRLWEQQPAAMQAALARHDFLLRDIIEAHGGHVIKSTGDGLYAVFAHVAESVAATLASQQALVGEPWTGLPQPLRVRMGLHTGEAQFRDGDYFGPAINRAARLMSIASGGQILLSSATTELVRDQLPAGATLYDLGEHRLKGLTRPERVFQLSGPELPADFPPLHSLNTLPNNLPLQLTSFVGREHEMAEVTRLLGTTRLLTLTGPGGTGKTRLSLQVAAEVLDTFADGVWLVELAPLSDPALMPQAVASVWNIREQAGRSLVDTLTDFLRAKSLLLILDNCEHLIDACAQLVVALLGVCPKLKILPSSREALGVAGEITYRVPSLSLPNASNLTPEILLQSESARLFVERAQAAQAHFALTDHNLNTITQICRRLDGIPLALELAAARVKMLTVEQVAARLDDRFRLLTGGSRTALPRQQTLRALIDWSYDLLGEPERSALARLSVFAGGWTFDAAEAVLGLDALELLSHLVDKSLVVIEETAKGEEMRYSFLETIRQYARDKLLEAGEASAARERHLDYYLHLAAEAESKLEGPQMLEALNQVEPELDNIRVALEWALERDPEIVLQLAARLTYFWQGRGHITEGRNWLSEAFSRMKTWPAGESTREQLALRAKALRSSGVLAFAQGELLAARSASTESARLAREAGEKRTLVDALGMLGFAVVWMGDAATAEAVIREGLEAAQASSYKLGLGVMLSVRANQAAQLQGDFEAARAYWEEGLQLMRETGNPFFVAIFIMGAGSLALSQGNYAQARSRLEESERLFYELGDKHMAIGVQSQRAHIERQLGHYPQALELYRQSILAWQELGHRVSLAHEFECLAFIARAQSQLQRAACLFGAAEILREHLTAPMTANERIEYDQNVSALGAQMHESAFATAWAEGRAMSVEQAVEFALKGTRD
jgi:predicted ATPase/class 3 adenylate cyclase